MRKKNKDPFFNREKEKYENPIPSREYILDVLKQYGRPMTKNKLIDALDIHNESDQDALKYRLKAMLRDGQVMQDRRNRYCLIAHINLQRGKIQAHPEGYGFFIPDNGHEDLVIPPSEMRKVMHGDTVLAYPSGVGRRGRTEAHIHEVLIHANDVVAGRFFNEHGVGIVIPDNKRLTQDVTILPGKENNAQNGQIVLAKIVTFPSKQSQAIGEIISVLGDHLAPGMEIDIAIHSHHIPCEWPAEVLKQVKNIPSQVQKEDCVGRADLRHIPFVTIDGEDAKDFDDAVYCCPKPKGGFELLVAIADVGHYVKPGSPLDEEARLRGNSVYFPGHVIPMLPEALSNGICSLNPHVDRLCVVAEMHITEDGKIERSRIKKGVFRSQARLTYNQVWEWLSKGESDKKHVHLWPMIQSLYALYHALIRARRNRGAIDFETTETYIQFDKQRKIKRIVPVVRNDAHRIIEECMLAANVTVAEFLERTKLPILYRVHPPPEEEKIDALREFLGELGVTLPGGNKPSPKDFQKTIASIQNRPDRQRIETIMLRSLKQAQYIEKNNGHFGLAYPSYTHFTSPIRRYPDLLIHRAIAHSIDASNQTVFHYTPDEMSRLGLHCSSTERRADEATRDVVSWLKCEYMQDKIGKVYSGRIVSVTGFGLFVELNDIYVEGLVHITSLRNDYYTFDPVKHRLRGERGGLTYRLGDPMTVLVAAVHLEDRKIDFEPAEEEEISSQATRDDE